MNTNTMDKYVEEMELCLYQRCASAFYDIPSYKIMRKDPYQINNKDLCTYRNSHLGFDFLICKKTNVTNVRKTQDSHIEREAEMNNIIFAKGTSFQSPVMRVSETRLKYAELNFKKRCRSDFGISIKTLDQARLNGTSSLCAVR